MGEPVLEPALTVAEVAKLLGVSTCAHCGMGQVRKPNRFCSKSCARKAAPRRTGSKFWRRVDKSAGPFGCWLWSGATNHGGYGHTAQIGGSTLAHRVAWFLTNGPLPPLSLDHLCRNTRCVNPAHLDPVPQSVNRARVKVRVRLRDHCKHGHPFDDANTLRYLRDGSPRRACRTCNRDAQARHRARA